MPILFAFAYEEFTLWLNPPLCVELGAGAVAAGLDDHAAVEGAAKHWEDRRECEKGSPTKSRSAPMTIA
jgi:hypothetical protein